MKVCVVTSSFPRDHNDYRGVFLLRLFRAVREQGAEVIVVAPQGPDGQAAQLIDESERPLILAGHGVTQSGAEEELKVFAERACIPVAMTLLGIGGLPASHVLNLGMMGMHGEAYANRAIQSADLLIAFGMRFDDRVTGRLNDFAPNAKKIHFDVDP